MRGKDIPVLVCTCLAGHRQEMRIEDGVMPDSALQDLVKASMKCPHCKEKLASTTIEHRKPS